MGSRFMNQLSHSHVRSYMNYRAWNYTVYTLNFQQLRVTLARPWLNNARARSGTLAVVNVLVVKEASALVAEIHEMLINC